MMSVRKFVAPLLFAVLFLAGCQSSQSAGTLFEEATAGLPGQRFYLAVVLPEEYESTLKKVNQAYQAGEDVWLFASDEVLDQMDGGEEFRAWLGATRPLLFHTEAGPVYLIPADLEMDRLAFVTDHHLEKWADVEQLASLWRDRGDNLRSEQAFAEAVDAYEQSLALDPRSSDAYTGMGAALLGLGENELALGPLLQAVSLDPENYWAQRLLGNAYLNLKRYALAVDPLTRAYLLHPEHPQTLIGVALALGRSGQQEQALRVLDEAASALDDPALQDDIRTLRDEFSGQ